MGKTLKYHLKNVDGETVFQSIRTCISTIETELGIKMHGDNLIGIALHISCMIDRLKEQETMVQYPDKENYMVEHQRSYTIVRQAVKFLESTYDIKIPDDEICFIMNFFVAENPENEIFV
jgi:transcriptional regulatory protein LevR